MGQATSIELVRQCIGHEIPQSIVKTLAGKRLVETNAIFDRFKALEIHPGLDLVKLAFVTDLDINIHLENMFNTFDTNRTALVDIHEVLAAMILCSKTTAGSKVRGLFDIYDLDGDGTLNQCECVLMLRSILLAVSKITRGIEPHIPGLEAIVKDIFFLLDIVPDEVITITEWLTFCKKTKLVHILGKMLDFNKSPCRKGLQVGSKVTLSKAAWGEGGPAVTTQRSSMKTARAGVMCQRRAATAREGKSKYARSSVMKIKEVFDSIDRNGSGYVDEEEWRMRMKNLPFLSEAFQSVDRNQDGQISIVEVLYEVYPFASDLDLTKMLEWVSEKPDKQGVMKRELTAAEKEEMMALFHMYDRDGNGELTIHELSSAMSENVGLTIDDIRSIFLDVGKTDGDYITASEFADMFIEFLGKDSSIEHLLRKGIGESHYPS